MSQPGYYLIDNGKETGPFDLLLMIKKIRNGKLHANDQVFIEGQNHPLPAIDVPELRPYFDKSSPENKVEKPPKLEQVRTVSDAAQNFDLGMMLKDAWVFFGDNQTASLVAGSMAIAGIAFNLFLSVLLPAALSAIVACSTAALMMFLLMAYMYRKADGESADPMFFRQLMTVRGIDILLISVIAGGLPLGIPAALGAAAHPIGYLLMIPGAAAFSLFIFAPLLILTDLNFRAADSLQASMQWMISQGLGTILKATTLIALNLVAVTLFFVPVFVSLPLTTMVLVDLFRQRVSTQISHEA